MREPLRDKEVVTKDIPQLKPHIVNFINQTNWDEWEAQSNK
jgi:hypothetical protein